MLFAIKRVYIVDKYYEGLKTIFSSLLVQFKRNTLYYYRSYYTLFYNKSCGLTTKNKL